MKNCVCRRQHKTSMVQTSLTAWLKKPTIIEKVTKSANPPATPITSKDDAQPPYPLPSSKSEQETRSTNGNGHLGVAKGSIQITRQVKYQLPPNVELSPITPELIQSFRRLNTLMLPVPYTDNFYDEILHDPVAASISMVALWHDAPKENSESQVSKSRVVAGIRCKLLRCPSSQSPRPTSKDPTGCNSGNTQTISLYISTIVTLAPFRHHGLARALLNSVLARAVDEYGVKTVSAHVWEANTEARQWYAKQGFREVLFEPEYYRRLKPGGAWVVERPVTVKDLLDAPNADRPFISKAEQEPS